MTDAINPMPSFAGILIEGKALPFNQILDLANAMGVAGTDPERAFLILLPLSKVAVTQTDLAASRISQFAPQVISIYADTAADEYALSRYTRGTRTRHVLFMRDAANGDQWQLEGTAEDWETDLLFALSEEDFIDYLSDDDSYTDVELDRARLAHQHKNLQALMRRPPLLAASLWEWLGTKGIDLQRPITLIRKPSIWERLFGRKDR